MPKKAVLFDLDGTLLNSLPDISRCMNTVLEKHGLPVYPMLDYRYMTGNGALKLTQRALGEAHQELEQTVLAEYAALYAKHCYDESYLYPGIADMMQDLKAAGYRLVVLSNKDDPDIKAMESLESDMRKQISKQLKSNARYKRLFGKELICEDLPSFLTDKDERETVECFRSFTTYFKGFNTNRENMYSSDEKSTAIAYRLSLIHI